MYNLNVHDMSTHKKWPPTMGDSRKYPYHTTDGMSILTPPCPRKFQNAYPPLALRIPKSLTPPLLQNFPLLFQTLWNFCLSALKTSNERETCTFSLCKRILFTIFSQTIKQLKFVNVSTPKLFLLSIIFKLLTT